MSGAKFMQIELQGDTSYSYPAEHTPHLKKCAFCLSYSDTPVLPSREEVAPFAVSFLFSLPILFYRSPSPLYSWATPQSRAPPSYS